MVSALLAARLGLQVVLFEAHTSLGGGVRTEHLTLPGFNHDVCSAVHPFGRASPVLRSLALEEEGLEWIDPTVALAHPLIGQQAVLLHRSVADTAASIGSRLYSTLLGRIADEWGYLEGPLLGPILRLPNLRSLLSLAAFGPLALTPASLFGQALGERGSALWAGLAGHSLLPLERIASSAVAVVLAALGHRVGWPFPRGGAVAIAHALEKKMRRAGVEVQLGRRVDRLSDLPSHRVAILDLSSHQLLTVVGDELSAKARRGLQRYRLGPGLFKVDYALSEPTPWSDPSVALAGTVHLGGSASAIARSERLVWSGQVSDDPFVLVVQPTLFDPTRAPDKKHVLWAYLHTPNGWNGDALEILERQIERYAPGFSETVLERSVMRNQDYQAYNPNYTGGDIMGGENTLGQVIARPFLSRDPYHLGRNVFCCSASVPPGGGIHGMGGYLGLQSALRRFFPNLVGKGGTVTLL